MREMGLGRPVPRTEDLQLLRGLGRYTDDIVLPREARLYILRRPHASAGSIPPLRKYRPACLQC